MAEPIQLIAADDANVVAYAPAGPVSAAQLRETAARLAARLPARRYAVNLCSDRYCFLLTWLAACLREQVSLLPPDQSAGTLRGLAAAYPDQHTVDDEAVARLLNERGETHASRYAWLLPRDRVVAVAFTSGSTGRPQPHPKQWGTLTRNAELAAAQVLGGSGTHVIATVPAQHAYGLETSVITAISAGCVLHAAQPFFPQDVQAALERIPEPRALVTTPAHLQVLLAARVRLPAVRAVVSATAPLTREMALQIEREWQTTVHEIYGCTEAGIVAWRRTSQADGWRTFRGGCVGKDGSESWYAAPHLPRRIQLQDEIELLSDTHFGLLGRANDMVKVAGKRASLDGLTQQLRDLPGVLDAVVFVPSADRRPAALVVAPGLLPDALLDALRERVDAVFLPRPLVCVERLPRNSLGKLPHEALLRAIGVRAIV